MGTTVPIKSKGKLTEFRNYYRDAEYKPRNYALIVLGLNSALRIGDMLALRWRDVYCGREGSGGTGNQSCLGKGADHCTGKGRYREHLTLIEKKTGKENMIALNNSSQEALEFYRETLDVFDAEAYIFASQKAPYNGITRSQAFRIIRKAALSCGLDDRISCHSLRKTFGYHAWKNGFPPALLMNIYNHSSYDVTKKYLCIDQIERDEVYLKTFL